MTVRRDFQKKELDNVFGQVSNSARLFRTALKARVSMSDHETVALQIRACGGALTGGFGGSQCGWKELGSGTSLSTPLPVTLAMAMALAALLSVTSCSSTRPKDYFQISVVD